MDGRVGPCAVALLAVEVLDEGGESVEVAAGCIPANKDFAGVCAEVEREHLLLVVHIYLDLLGILGVGDGVAVADLDFGTILAAGSEKSANDAFLVGGAAERVVEYREDSLSRYVST
jgi:3-dehydroquinate synthase class II